MENTKFGKDLLEGKGALTVPVDFNSGYYNKIINKRKRCNSTYHCDLGLYFRDSSDKLIPGKRYGIKLFPVLEDNVTSNECLAFLKQQGIIFVGAQGLLLLQDKKPEIFLKDKYFVYLEEKDFLPKDFSGRRRLPFVHLGSRGWTFDGSANFDRRWDSYDVLVCFCELE